MMLKKAILFLAFACPLVSSAQHIESLPLRLDDVVATRGGVSLTVGLVDQKVAEMPREIRAGYFDEPDRIARLVDTTLLTLQLAHKATEMGISVDMPSDATELERITALANAVLREQNVLQSDEDYELLARERYQARKKEYAGQAHYTFQRIYIDPTIRGQVAAKILAEAALARAQQGEAFDVLVQEYSDQEGADPLNGTLAYSDLLHLSTPLQVAIGGFVKPDVSKVIEDSSGYHIIRLVEYHPPVVPPFDEVKGKIIEQMKQEAITSAKTTFMRDLSLQDVELNDPVVQRLIVRYYRSEDSELIGPVPMDKVQ